MTGPGVDQIHAAMEKLFMECTHSVAPDLMIVSHRTMRTLRRIRICGSRFIRLTDTQAAELGLHWPSAFNFWDRTAPYDRRLVRRAFRKFKRDWTCRAMALRYINACGSPGQGLPRSFAR